MAAGMVFNLQELLQDGKLWHGRGLVEEIEENAAFGWLYRVRLQPEDVVVQVRGCWLMGGAAEEGVFVPVAIGDEVVCLFAGGDLNRGVLFGSMPSEENALPTDWDGQSSILIKHLASVAVEAPEVLLGSREASSPVSLDPLTRACVEAAVAAVATALDAGAAAAAAGDGGATALGAASAALAAFSAASTAASKVKGE